MQINMTELFAHDGSRAFRAETGQS